MGRPQSWVASSSLGWHSKAAEVGAGGGPGGGHARAGHAPYAGALYPTPRRPHM